MMETVVDCYGHIPGVRLATPSELTFDYWKLMQLPFEHWAAMEDPVLSFVQPRYTGNQPVFLNRSIVVAGEIDEVKLQVALRESFEADLAAFSAALLFTFWWPLLPEPVYSATYYHIPEWDSTYRVFGPNERDLILMPYSEMPEINIENAQRLINIFLKFKSIDSVGLPPEILRMIDAIKIGSQPGMTILDVISHFVVANEEVFNPEGKKPLGKTFGRRIGLIFCPQFDQLGRWKDFFRRMYAVRSDVLHGRDPSKSLKKLNQFVTDLYRFLFLLSYQTCCQLAYLKSEYGDLSSGLNSMLNEVDAVQQGGQSAFDQFYQRLQFDWLEKSR